MEIKKPQVLAMYLPQYHRVKENDEWWGEGFTEWTAVKKSEPLFEGHNQPRRPLDDRYYDLLDKATMEWQAGLANKYGIDGFCIYHYWFKDGRRILEKPAENLLKWKDLPMRYCFSWANEPWGRSWSNINSPNTWANKFEKKETGVNQQDDGILLPQKYGDEKQWKEHFDYLLPFFQDERYIKLDEKPVFIIYRPDVIYSISRMLEYWRNLARRAGIKGIYVIGTNMRNDISGMDAGMLQLPGCMDTTTVLRRREVLGGSMSYRQYDEMWMNLLQRDLPDKRRTFLCGLVDFDNSPRNGRHGWFVEGNTVAKFKDYFAQLVGKSVREQNEFVFLNAWNEWGESCYLEPDQKNGYAYLEAVKEVMHSLIDCTKRPEYMISSKDDSTVVSFLQKKVYMFQHRYKFLHYWMWLREQGIGIDKFFIQRGIKTIALYGLGIEGKHFRDELYAEGMEISYAIDRQGNVLHDMFPIYRLEDELPEVDVIVVSVIDEFFSIYKVLREKVKCSVYSLEEIVYES